MRTRIVAASCVIALMFAASARSQALRETSSSAAPTARRQNPPPDQRAWDEKRIPLPRAGMSMAYVPHAATPHVVLLVSGASGWDRRMVGIARAMATQAIVVGISYQALKRTAGRESGCWYVASDFEIMSHAAQKTLKLPQYHAPILVGYAEGAAIVYAALAGGPATTFAGAISAGFCPTVAITRDICAGDAWTPEYDDRKHVNTLPPLKTLPRDWYVLEGDSEQFVFGECGAAIRRRSAENARFERQ